MKIVKKTIPEKLIPLVALFLIARIVYIAGWTYDISMTAQKYKDYDDFFVTLYNAFPSADWDGSGDEESAAALRSQMTELYGDEYYRCQDREALPQEAVRNIDYYLENGYMTQSCYDRFQEDIAPCRLYLIANYTNCHIVGEIVDHEYLSQTDSAVQVRFTIQLKFFRMDAPEGAAPEQIMTTHCEMIRTLQDGHWLMADIRMEDILEPWLKSL